MSSAFYMFNCLYQSFFVNERPFTKVESCPENKIQHISFITKTYETPSVIIFIMCQQIGNIDPIRLIK